MTSRSRVNTDDLVKAFRESRNQSLSKVKENEKRPQQKSPFERGNNQNLQKRNTSSDKYQNFLNKYLDLENNIDSFKTQDLMYFFREKARDCGYKYVISNMKRDMGIFKRLQDNYEPNEICLMIEFLFTSEQDYLDPSTLQPTVLASSWCNKIYSDSLLWVDDKYVPKVKKKHSNREWQGDSNNDRATIGGWD
jgi:hypothetical protein